jgi:predicted nucleotidyltransferase
VRSLEAFGSILRDDFDAGRSDVDVLVDFEAQVADSFSNFLDLKESLEAMFQRPVDLEELRAIRNPQPPVALLHRAEQITNLCGGVILVSTWTTSKND